MKKLFVLGILFLFLMNIAIAGRTIDLDFSEGNTQLVTMQENDRVKFFMKGSEHTIIADKISSQGVDLDVFLFVDQHKNPFYATVNKKMTLNLDIERDEVTDLRIGLYSILNENGAILIFHKPVEEKITGGAVIDISSEESEKTNLLLPTILIVAILLIFYLVFKTKTGKK